MYLTTEATGEPAFFVKRATKLNDILATRNIAASIHSLSVTLYYDSRTLEDSSSGAIMSVILLRLPHIQKFSLDASCRRPHILLFACNGLCSGHSSLVQISKSYDIASGRYFRFSFYNNQDMPQLAMSLSLAVFPCSKFDFFHPFCDNLLYYPV
jgi:hypothetical protein